LRTRNDPIGFGVSRLTFPNIVMAARDIGCFRCRHVWLSNSVTPEFDGGHPRAEPRTLRWWICPWIPACAGMTARWAGVGVRYTFTPASHMLDQPAEMVRSG